MFMVQTIDASYEEAIRAENAGNYPRAFEIYEKLAKEGHVYSLVPLAQMYIQGKGAVKDLSKAEELLNQAVNLGVPEAAFQKANIWLDRGDMHRYFVSIQQAARMGLLVAQYYLGLCYINGRGVIRDNEKGLEAIHEAARRGHIGARAHLARRLLRRPLNLFGFVRGLVMLFMSFVQGLRIAFRNPHDERIR